MLNLFLISLQPSSLVASWRAFSLLPYCFVESCSWCIPLVSRCALVAPSESNIMLLNVRKLFVGVANSCSQHRSLAFATSPSLDVVAETCSMESYYYDDIGPGTT